MLKNKWPRRDKDSWIRTQYHHSFFKNTLSRYHLSIIKCILFRWLIRLFFILSKIYITKFTILSILQYKIQWLLVHLQCYANITTIQFENILISRKGNPMPIKLSLTIPPFFQALGNTELLFVSLVLPIIDISYEWNHKICNSLWQTSFT